MNKTRTKCNCRLLWLLALLLVGSFGSRSYAEAVRNILARAINEPTGAGVVYASEEKTDSLGSSDIDYDRVQSSDLWYSNSKNAYLYAAPNSGYTFKCWTGNGLGDKDVLYSRQANTYFLLTHDNNESRTNYTFTAHFAKTGALTVVSADEALGTVELDSIPNRVGDTVTMTAYPDVFAGKFAGWADAQGKIVSTENPLTVVVSDSVRYTAMFERVDMQTTGFYARLVPIDNDGNHNGRALGLAGVSEVDMASLNIGFAFGNSLIIGDGNRMLSSPAFVFKLTGTPDYYGGLTNLDGGAQGHLLSDILGSAAEGTTLGLAKINEHSKALYLKNGGFVSYLANDDRVASATEEGFNSVTSPTLQCKMLDSNGFRWEVLPITGDSTAACFGAWPQSEKKLDDCYFTTMYTAFPYECLDGVTAFVVTGIKEDGELEVKKIESGIVPKYTAVILACRTTEPVTNRLLPLLDETQEPITENLLKGEIWVRDVLSDNTDNTFPKFRKAFDEGSMRVMNDNLDFGKEFNSTYIPNNSVYLDISSQANKQDTYRLPNGLVSGISPIIYDRNDQNDGCIYNIHGQYMGKNIDTLPRGIYIRNGKKIVK